MTTDMAFECLLVSSDQAVVSLMNGLLGKLSIATNVCSSPAQAVDRLSGDTTDLLIVDWEEDSAELLRHVNQSRRWRKPTVVVLSELESAMTDRYFLLRKPVTRETGAQSLKQAYSKMLHEHRQHTRYALMSSLMATDQNGRLVPVMVTNIGEGGIGLSTKESLGRGDVLSFSLLLPDSDTPVHIGARVLWVRQYGAVGCEFAHIPSPDLDIIYNWLKHKCQVKDLMAEL